jgi:hypothetical protein
MRMREYCVRAAAEIKALRCERDQGLKRVEELELVLEAKDDEMLEDLEQQVVELKQELSRNCNDCKECIAVADVPRSPDRVLQQAHAHLKKWRECAPESPWTAGSWPCQKENSTNGEGSMQRKKAPSQSGLCRQVLDDHSRQV